MNGTTVNLLYEEISNTTEIDLNYSVGDGNDVPKWVYQVASVYLLLICVFGTLLNGSVIYFFIKTKSLWSSFNLIVLNLIGTELLASAGGVPIDLVSALSYGQGMSESACYMTGFGHTLSGMSSIFTLTTLAISRSFIVSCQPLSAGSNCLSQKSRGSNSYFAILTSIIIIWSFSIIVSIPPILGWGSYVLDQSRISCGPNWSAPDQDFQYCLFMFILGFFVPVGIIMSSNFSVVLTMRRHTASKTNPYLRSIAERRERGATRILMLMTLAFFICWMPYACLSLFSMAGGNVQSAWHVLPILFAKSSVCWNPFLYIFCNDEFKRIIRTHFSDPVPASMLLLERGTFGRRARHPGLMVRSEARQLTLSPKSSKEFKSCMAHFSLDNERSSIVIVQNHGEILAIGRV